MLLKKIFLPGLIAVSLVSSNIVCMEQTVNWGPLHYKVSVQTGQVDEEEVVVKKVLSNTAACGVGALCGYILKAMWFDTGNGSEFSKGLASWILFYAPTQIAKELGASSSLADISFIAAAVLAKVYDL